MRVKRELWRTTMAPVRLVAPARLAALARSAREKNEDVERRTNADESRERKSEGIYERENLSE